MNQPPHRDLLIPAAVVLGAVALWIAWGLFVHARFPEGTSLSLPAQQAMAARGQFGDLFGGINALFTALILAGAVYTIWLQKKELHTLEQQQVIARMEHARATELAAYTALINAKVGLLNVKWEFAQMSAQALAKVDPSSPQSAAWYIFAEGRSKAALSEVEALESLAARLASVLKEVRVQPDGSHEARVQA